VVQQILLTRGCCALVDDNDYEKIRGITWHLTGRGYVAGRVKTKGVRQHVYLHRFLLNAQPGQFVDHLDGDRLNNTRANLRLVTRAQNQWNRKVQRNRSGYKGVSWHRHKGRFYARIQVNGQRYNLGYFDTAEEAAEAYDEAARRLFGEYARLNGVNGSGKAELALPRHGADDDQEDGV
jgi:hypothetical protein